MEFPFIQAETVLRKNPLCLIDSVYYCRKNRYWINTRNTADDWWFYLFYTIIMGTQSYKASVDYENTHLHVSYRDLNGCKAQAEKTLR